MPKLNAFLIAVLACALHPAHAAIHCIGSVDAMRTAIAAEASAVSGVAEFRIKNGILLQEQFLFTAGASSQARSFVIDGGWNSACTAKAANGRSTLGQGIRFSNAHPYYIQSSDLMIRDIRVVGSVDVMTGLGARTIDRSRIETAAGAYVYLRGAPITVTNTQFTGGEIFITSTPASNAETTVRGNEFREIHDFRLEVNTTGAVVFRSNTVVSRSPVGWVFPGVALSTLQVYAYSEPSSFDFSHNLFVRSTTYDLDSTIAFSGGIHLDADNDGLRPPFEIFENWFQIRANNAAGSEEFNSALATPSNRNVAKSFDMPFATSDTHLVPSPAHEIANYGTPRPGDAVLTDIRGAQRVIGGRIDVGASESDALFRSGFD
jgi:hypothetical protein